MTLMAAQSLEIHFARPEYLGWLWLVPLLAGVMVVAWVRRRALRRRFAADAHWKRLASPGGAWRGVWRGGMALLALASLIVAGARPQWDRRERAINRVGRDVVFVVDVSRSMLAQDVAPNRLERVKGWIREAIDVVEGDRVGLVAFAGGNVLMCPLTLDYTYFRMALDQLEPSTVGRGGTMIGDAIRKALNEAFDSAEGRHRDIVLFTDGEDQGSFPIEAAETARAQRVRIIALGVGSEGEGARIPTPEDRSREFMQFQGADVRSRLASTELSRIALGSYRGVYFNVGTGHIDFGKVYKDLIASAAGSEFEDETVVVEYREAFQYVLTFALLALVLEGLVHVARRHRSAA
ncbi:MAG: VWA domain-containing protein [Phycisphaeraceae bacterium]|nr:VWA domain-containing protein [Phycisphaeraceae bacterium]MCW5753078.1 VWA domain-containing protein [Phycisphaeraceae bacterium]